MKKSAYPLCASCVFTLLLKTLLMTMMPTLFLLVNGDCPKPGDLPNMQPKNGTEDPMFAEETIVIYQCDSGYVSKSGSGKSVCQTGEWTPPDLDCQRVSCGPPPTIENGKTVGGIHTLGASVTVECFAGYILWSSDGNRRLSESPELVCNAYGKWTGDVPKCLSVTCPPLEDVPYSEKVLTHTGYRGKVTYSCDTGYVHSSGDLERSCQLDGTWSGTTPICKDANCEDPDTEAFTIEHPDVKKCVVQQGLEPGNIAVCECKEVSKTVNLKCQNNGLWKWESHCKGTKPETTTPTDGDVSTGPGDMVTSTEVPSEDTGLPSKIIAAIVFSIMALIIIIIISLVVIHRRRKKSSNKSSIRKAHSSDVQNGIEMKSLNQKEDAV